MSVGHYNISCFRATRADYRRRSNQLFFVTLVYTRHSQTLLYVPWRMFRRWVEMLEAFLLCLSICNHALLWVQPF